MSTKKQVSVYDELQTLEDVATARLETLRYPDESELETVSDALSGESARDGKWEKIGTRYEGIFQGLRYQESKDGRPFAMASLLVKNAEGTAINEDIFLPVRAAAFFYSYEFPQGQFIRIEYIGDKPIKGRNAMKLFKFQFSRALQLKPLEMDCYSVSEMKSIYNPIKRKLPKGAIVAAE